MLVELGTPRLLGSATPRLAFGGEGSGRRAARRLLVLDGEPAYELSAPCGTCAFLFERLAGAQALSVEELRDRLATGLGGLDEQVVASFGALLGQGSYLPLLLDVEPRLVEPARPGDYFAEEQVSTWGVSPFWGLPGYPATAYYRTFETDVSDQAHLYEFVVPMTPPAWDDRERVAHYVACSAPAPPPPRSPCPPSTSARRPWRRPAATGTSTGH